MSEPSRPVSTDQHSPGPWKLNWTYAGGGCLEDYPELQYVNIASHNFMQVAPNGLSLTGYVRPADAHLIAAAPELLAAAKAALSYITITLGQTRECTTDLRDAIAKAEGKL